MTTSHSLADLSGYLFICSVAVICGLGVIRLLCVPLAWRTSLLLAPVATQTLWALVLGMGVVSGIPVRQLAMPVWIVTAVFALYGLWMLVVGTPRALDGHDSR